MAAHIRKQLRNAVAARLTGLPTTGARVKSYADTVAARAAPELQVWCTNEEASIASLENIQERHTRVEVHGYVSGALADLHDLLDQVALEVEVFLATPVPLGSAQVQLAYAGAEITTDSSGEVPVGEIRLDYVALIYTASNAPDVAISV